MVDILPLSIYLLATYQPFALPLYVRIERFFPDDSKNVSFVDMGLVLCIGCFIDNLKLWVGG